MKGARKDEGEPHSGIKEGMISHRVGLGGKEVERAHRKKYTSRSFDRVSARTEMPINFVKVIPESTY